MKWSKKLYAFLISVLLLIIVYGTLCTNGRGSSAGCSNYNGLINYHWALAIILIVGLFFSFPKSKIFVRAVEISKYISQNKSHNIFYRTLKSLFNAFFWSSLIMLIFFSPSFLYVKNNYSVSKYFEIIFLVSSLYSILYIIGLRFKKKSKYLVILIGILMGFLIYYLQKTP